MHISSNLRILFVHSAISEHFWCISRAILGSYSTTVQFQSNNWAKLTFSAVLVRFQSSFSAYIERLEDLIYAQLRFSAVLVHFSSDLRILFDDSAIPEQFLRSSSVIKRFF